jgi:putative membrane protein
VVITAEVKPGRGGRLGAVGSNKKERTIMMQWGWGYGGNGAWSIVGSLLSILVVGVILVVRSLTADRHPAAGQWPTPPVPPEQGSVGSPALRILEERYARGDIDREEFLARKQDLTS